MTFNCIAARMDGSIRRFETAPLIGFPDFAAKNEKMEEAAPAEPTVKELYDRYGLFFFKNYVSETLIGMAQPRYSKYMARINDLIVHSHLLRAGLELRLMDDRPEDIAEALAALGPETWNSLYR